MKKILAVFMLSMLVFSLASCFYDGVEIFDQDEFLSYRQYEDGVYYTALDIGVKSYLYDSGNGETRTQFELYVGLRAEINDRLMLNSNDEKLLYKLINEKTGVDFQYSGVNIMSQNSGDDFVRYCYSINALPNILNETDKNFGFFWINRSFTLDNPEWVSKIKESVYAAVTELFASFINRNVKIDDNAIRLRYYFETGTNFYTDDAIQVEDPNYPTGYFIWETDNGSDFEHLHLYYRAMASGWYIFPIVIGIAVVAILSFWLKGKKKENVFLTETTDKDVESDVLK